MVQRTEVVDDASWVMGFLDILDPAIDTLKTLLKLSPNSYNMPFNSLRNISGTDKNSDDFSIEDDDEDDANGESDFDLDAFIMKRLSLDSSNLEVQLEAPKTSSEKRIPSGRRIWRPNNTIAKVQVQRNVV